MDKATYQLLENWMHSCMTDSAHDREHVYRVLYSALELAGGEENVNYDVLIAACLSAPGTTCGTETGRGSPTRRTRGGR